MNKKWKIYTRQGDKGMTSLIGGKKVPKFDDRIEAYGTVDELISYIGLLRDLVKDKPVTKQLVQIQDRLMVCASLLALPESENYENVPLIEEKDIEYLEDQIDQMEENLEQLTHFILPGGHPQVSYCHIIRNICRRAERRIILLNEKSTVPENVIKYVNRLSDYFFVLSRKLSRDFNVDEIPWNPNL